LFTVTIGELYLIQTNGLEVLKEFEIISLNGATASKVTRDKEKDDASRADLVQINLFVLK